MASEWPSWTSRAVRLSAAFGYGLALTTAVLSLTSNEIPLSARLPGAMALPLIVALPSTLALGAVRDRPALLLAAALTALSSVRLSYLFVLMIAPGIAWLVSYLRVRGSGALRRAVAVTALVWFLWVGLVSALLLHLDPVCAETLSSGVTQFTDPSAQGLEPGWIWDQPATFSGSGTLSPDVVSTGCSSDHVSAWEALAALGFAAGALAAGWFLLEPLPGHQTRVVSQERS